LDGILDFDGNNHKNIMTKEIKTNLYNIFLSIDGKLTDSQTTKFLILVSDVANWLATYHF